MLCEDLFLVYWISRSPENDEIYFQEVRSEALRNLRLYLDRGRGQMVDRKTGVRIKKARFDEFKAQLDAAITPRRKIEDLAAECGLADVYDIVYRNSSPEVHGKMLRLLEKSAKLPENSPVVLGDVDAIRAALPAITCTLRAILFIVDNRLRGLGTTEREIRTILKV